MKGPVALVATDALGSVRVFDFSTGTLGTEVLMVPLVPVRAWDRKEINGVGSEALLPVCASGVLIIATLGALTVLVGTLADDAARVLRDSIGG